MPAWSSAPGVTSNSITVGTISTQTGVLASNFGSLIYGEKAYFAYINAQGGVNPLVEVTVTIVSS